MESPQIPSFSSVNECYLFSQKALFCIHITSHMTLDQSSWWRTMPCLHFPARVLDLHKNSRFSHSLFAPSLIQTRMNTKRLRSSDNAPRQIPSEMAIITEHLLSIPTQSEETWKAWSERTSWPLESPSSFFCWLQLSASVWARCRMITLLSQMSPSSIFYSERGDVPGRCDNNTPCGVHTCRNGMLNVTHLIVECHPPCWLCVVIIPFKMNIIQTCTFIVFDGQKAIIQRENAYLGILCQRNKYKLWYQVAFCAFSSPWKDVLAWDIVIEFVSPRWSPSIL